MTKILYLTSLIIIMSSCKQELKNDISDEYKLELLNTILKDTTFNFDFNKDIVSNYPLLTPLPAKKLPYVSDTPIERITKWLLMSDTTYIRLQIKENETLDLKKLEAYGLAVFDYEGYVKENLSYSKIRKIIRKENIKRGGNEFNNLINVSKPIFNKKLNLAYISFAGGCIGVPRYIYEKNDEKWKKYRLNDWINKHDLMDPGMKELFEELFEE